MPQKLNSSIFLLDTIFHTTMTSSSKTLRLKPSSVLNILGVSFSRDLSWKDHITSLSKQASKRLGVLRRLQYFFTPPQLLALYRGVVLHLYGVCVTHLGWFHSYSSLRKGDV